MFEEPACSNRAAEQGSVGTGQAMQRCRLCFGWLLSSSRVTVSELVSKRVGEETFCIPRRGHSVGWCIHSGRTDIFVLFFFCSFSVCLLAHTRLLALVPTDPRIPLTFGHLLFRLFWRRITSHWAPPRSLETEIQRDLAIENWNLGAKITDMTKRMTKNRVCIHSEQQEITK